MKKKIRLSESELRKLVSESVKEILKESNFDNYYADDNNIIIGKWNNLVDNLGAEKILNTLVTCASSDDLKQWIECIENEFDMSQDDDNSEWQ